GFDKVTPCRRLFVGRRRRRLILWSSDSLFFHCCSPEMCGGCYLAVAHGYWGAGKPFLVICRCRRSISLQTDTVYRSSVVSEFRLETPARRDIDTSESTAQGAEGAAGAQREGNSERPLRTCGALCALCARAVDSLAPVLFGPI